MKLLSHLIGAIALCVGGYSEVYYDLFVDRYYSPYMGSALFLAGHKALEKTEDFVLRPQDPPKQGFLYGLGRTAELTLLWLPINVGINTVQHEFFGHGFIGRSLSSMKVKSYHIDPPPPYGDGGGYTKIYCNLETCRVGEYQTISLAGLEAEAVLAGQQKLQWIAAKSLDPRSASLYSTATLSSLFYSLAPFDNQFFSGNDLESYLNVLNVLYPQKKPLFKRKLQKALLYNLVDPTLYYSFWSECHYILTGKEGPMPMISFGDYSFLPNLHVGLAPYGLEYYLENYARYQGKPFYSYIKAGEQSGIRYFGCGLHYDTLWVQDKMTLGFRLDSWCQPNFLASWPLQELMQGYMGHGFYATGRQRKLGGAFSLITRIGAEDSILSFYSDVGYKMQGYLPGFPLQKSLTLRLGLSSVF